MSPRLVSLAAALAAALSIGWGIPARANLDALSNQDAASGLKAALEKGAGVAVDLLGKTDGFLGNGAVKLLAIVAGFTAMLLGFLGSAGLALRIGRNLSADTSVWHQGLRGGVVLALVFITPVLGSLFLLHVGLASGFGAVLLSRPWKTKAAAPAPLTETPAPALP